DLEDIQGLHWIMSDDPLNPLPLEVFMRDYYEPRLLSRILAGEDFPEIKGLLERNRAQPEVRITTIEPSSDEPNRVDVTVEVQSTSLTLDQPTGPATFTSEV